MTSDQAVDLLSKVDNLTTLLTQVLSYGAAIFAVGLACVFLLVVQVWGNSR